MNPRQLGSEGKRQSPPWEFQHLLHYRPWNALQLCLTHTGGIWTYLAKCTVLFRRWANQPRHFFPNISNFCVGSSICWLGLGQENLQRVNCTSETKYVYASVILSQSILDPYRKQWYWCRWLHRLGKLYFWTDCWELDLYEAEIVCWLQVEYNPFWYILLNKVIADIARSLSGEQMFVHEEKTAR
jgi:hypothetical protein